VAKEVVIGSLAQGFQLGEEVGAAAEEDPATGAQGALGEQVRSALEASSGGHATAAGLAFLVFVMVYTPCLATVAEQKRVFGWRWALGAAVIQTSVAWGLAVLVFQVGSRW
jgi:ferrous iron transport protein B